MSAINPTALPLELPGQERIAGRRFTGSRFSDCETTAIPFCIQLSTTLSFVTLFDLAMLVELNACAFGRRGCRRFDVLGA